MFKFGSKNDINVECKCTVRLLDDNEVLQCVFHRDQKGFHLLDYVCEQLNLVEKDYFGLRYVDDSKQRHWLDPSRSIIKQIKGMSPIIFCFRVKFYPPDPHKLKEEITRYQIFLQLRRDLLHGRLYCSQTDSALLAAYVIQSELGDYDPEEHADNYVVDFKLLLKQTTKIEEKVMELHQIQLKGQVPSVAESNFLRKACLVDTYGVDPHPVKDPKGNQLYLGINHAGILTFQGSRKTHHFKWQDVQKLNYEGKMFIIHLMFNEKKHTIGFKCPSSAACKHLWRCAVEQRIFFTGRVEKEILDSNTTIKRDPPEFSRITSRSLSFRLKSGALTSSQSGSQDGESGFASLSRVKHSTPILSVDPLEEEPNVESTSSVDNTYHSPHSFNPDNSLTTVQEDLEPASHSSRTQGNFEDDYRNSMSVERKTYSNADMNHVFDHNEDVSASTSACEIQTNVTGFIPLFSSQEPYGPISSPSRNIITFKLLVPTLVFAVFFLSCVVLVILESESEVLSDVRRMPELIILRREYYEPFKEYVKRTLNSIFRRTE